MVNFLAEISKGYTDHAVLPLPSLKLSKKYDVYELDIRPHRVRLAGIPEDELYWDRWDNGALGYYDHFTGDRIELLYEIFLRIRDNLLALTGEHYTFYIENGIVYFSISRHPWLYHDQEHQARSVYSFLHSALNPDNPSTNIVDNIPAQVRLAVPSLNVKLSDGHNGVALNQGFTLRLHNDDGFFDDCESWNLFSTPLRLRKSTKENPTNADFRNIRGGMIDGTATSFDTLSVSASDMIRSMNEPVCDAIEHDTWHGTAIDESAIGRSIPIIYGTNRVSVTRLTPTIFLVGRGLSEIHGLYDRNGNRVAHTSTDDDIYNGWLRVSAGAQPVEAHVTGITDTETTDNRIGSIVRDLVKKQVPYISTYWNISETNAYIDSSSRINIVIDGGSLRGAISDVLSSDMAYFIQQSDDRFTIRKYGETYGTHKVLPGNLTRKPEKDFGRAYENWFSSCAVNYGEGGVFLFNENERDLVERYNGKRVTRTFDTRLADRAEAESFARLLGRRYSTLRQTLKVAVGVDTEGIELLDTVIADLTINGREFSRANRFFVREIDMAQDILTLEEI